MAFPTGPGERRLSGAEVEALPGEFQRLTGGRPEGVWQAPGRVNLIGEHTDYNAGLALPFAIDRRTTAAVRRRPDRSWRCWSLHSLDTAGRPVPVEVSLDRLGRDEPAGWARYVAGVAWALQRAGVEVPGADILIDSTLPVGSGLSSSAALTAAVAVAMNDLTAGGLGAAALVDVCHQAEAGFVGAPTGTLDQQAVLLARAGRALLIDFATGATEAVPLGHSAAVVVVDTGVHHDHASGDYGARRRECRAAASALGLPDLRHADPAMVEAGLAGQLGARARHVVTENVRVTEAVARLRAGRGIGDLLCASHRSLRDDFEVSCPELDGVVDAVVAAGADGARMTGGGFGGSVIVVGLPAEEVMAAALVGLEPFGRRPAAVFEAVASGPAGRVA